MTRLFQPSLAGGEVSPALYARVDIAKYQTALRRCRNFIVHRTGGVSNRAGFEFLGEVADSAVCPALIPFRFNNTTQVCLLEFGDQTMRVWYQGALVTAGSVPVSVATGYSAAEADAMGHAQSGDVMYLAHPSKPPRKLTRTSWTGWSFKDLTFIPSIKAPGASVSGYTLATLRTPDATLTPSASAGTVTLSASRTITTSIQMGSGEDTTWTTMTTTSPYAAFLAADVGRIVTVNGGRVVVMTVASDLCSVTGTTAAALSSAAAAGSGTWAVKQYQTTSSTGWTATRSGNNHSYTETISYKVSAVSKSTGEESLASDAFSVLGPTADDWPVGTKIILNGAEMDDVAYFRVYKAHNGLYGWIGNADGASFTDTNVTPDISDTAPEVYNPFAAAGDYPAKVALHQQRLVFANTANVPNGVWMSRTGFYESMTKSTPTKADDAISLALGSGEINAIKGLLSVQDLIVLTSGSENICNGGGTGRALTASAEGIVVKPQSYWGAGDLPPLVSGNVGLFVQGLGSAVRDIAYDYSVDGFVGNDRSILARHLLDGYEIISWAYAQVPDSTFWMVRNDGALLSLTYFKEQDIGAWALHTTDGAFERVAVIEGDDRHELYAVVRRTVGGVTKRYVERMASRRVGTIADARFLDSHLVYDGDPADEISGLDHLDGKTVGILADGNVLEDQLVTGGKITLPRDYRHVVVGLRYDRETVIETLDIDLGMVPGLGSVQGRSKSVARVTARVEASREFLAGPSEDRMALTKVRLPGYDAVPDPITGDVEITVPPGWNRHGRIVIRPNGPVPLTILGLAPDIVLGS